MSGMRPGDCIHERRGLLCRIATHTEEELTAAGYGFYASGVAERFLRITYDQCIEEELRFLGTPEQVIAQIRRLNQQIGGLNEMVIISNFGSIEHWKALKTQHLFAQYVMPAWRGTGGKTVYASSRNICDNTHESLIGKRRGYLI